MVLVKAQHKNRSLPPPQHQAPQYFSARRFLIIAVCGLVLWSDFTLRRFYMNRNSSQTMLRDRIDKIYFGMIL